MLLTTYKHIIMAYKNMKTNKQRTKALRHSYAAKNINKLSEAERESIYYTLFKRKLHTKPK